MHNHTTTRFIGPLIENEQPIAGELLHEEVTFDDCRFCNQPCAFCVFAVLRAGSRKSDEAAAAEEDEAEEEDAGKPILVTGSRIARPTLQSAVPLTSVTVEDLTGTGEVSLGDALNDLPSLRSTFSSGNSSRFIGTAGLSLLDLRGLGTDRTLGAGQWSSPCYLDTG